MKLNPLKVAALVCIVLIAVFSETSARPSFEKFGCKHDADVEVTCQRCAKLTKSRIVYPMCCYNDEDVHTWCENYIGYGQHE